MSSPSISALLENVNLINARLASRQLIWLVIPDKSSVYLDDSNSLRDLNLELRQSINVLDPLREAIIRKEVDVYFGNDTHLSPKGHGFVGDSVLDYLKRHP